MIKKLLESLPQLNKFDEFCNACTYGAEKKVIICGAGDQGMLNALLFKEHGIKVYAFADNNPQIAGTEIKGIQVISFDTLDPKEENYIFVNNDSYRDAKRTQLLSLGMKEDSIYTFDSFNPLFKNFNRKYVTEHIDDFECVYDMLSDEISKKTYIKYLSGVITCDIDYYKEIEVGDDYFIKGLVPIHNHHVYLDVGAYNGNTIEDFISFMKMYDKIYAFEPFESTARLIEEKKFPNTEIHISAASDYTGEKKFYCNDYGAIAMITTILEEGAEREELVLRTEAIDDVIGEEKATLIKMDIEGSELDALRGAQNTIINNKPYMAICVYHKKEDLIKIIPYVKSIVPDYKVYLRHHSSTACDLVAYFVINE